MKQFIGKTLTKTVPFMDGELEIRVLTVGDAKAIEKKTAEMEKAKKANKGQEADQLELLRFVVRMAVVGAADMTDADLDGFPITSLTKLSEAIMGMDDAGNA